MAWQAALLMGLVILTGVGIARRHPASVLGAWFFLILAPSSSVLPIVTEVAAEHRMYLPLAAVVAAVVTGLYVAGGRMVRNTRTAAVAAGCAVVLVVRALGAETRARNRVYWSAEDLWRDTVNKRPSDARPRVAYGEALASADRLAEAEAQLMGRLAAILADSRDAWVRDGARALGLADRAVRLTSGREPRMLEILSVAQAASGRFADAASTARAAIEIARERGDRAMVSSLEYRASAYESAARQAFGPRR